MLRRMQLPLAALGLAFLVSCGGAAYGPIQARATTEAEYLRAEVAAINLKGDEIDAAEGFFAAALSTKNAQEKTALADLAAANYRIALARHAVVVSAQAQSVSEDALKGSQEQVEIYTNVLSRVNTKAGGAE
jgi:hypothetical protein